MEQEIRESGAIRVVVGLFRQFPTQMLRRRRNEPSTNFRLFRSMWHIAIFIARAHTMADMDLTREELEKTRKEIELKLALPDEEFEKYAGDLLERAVKGLRRRR